ncbi:MAG: HmuY family protein [Bacteroidales bacterium]
MKLGPLAILIFMGVLLVSCFEEDQPVPPYVQPGDVESVSVQSSIYTSQTYFDFSSGSIVAENKNSEWVLGFECAAGGFHIRINSSDLWGIAHTGSTEWSADFSGKGAYAFISDKSDGNPDSTAVGDWVSFPGGESVYTNEVMLLGQYDGIVYKVKKKVQFISVDEASYQFLVGEPQGSIPDTVEILKNETFNYVHYSIENNEVKQLEPAKGEWDLLFTQYYTILLTDDGIPTPYYVRGVMLNPNQVESALDTTTHFLDVTASTALSLDFSSAQDAIGHDWKSVEVDESTNAAEYKVRPGYTYIVRDTDERLFKFRFRSYFNPSGEKGFPSFEYQKVNP